MNNAFSLRPFFVILYMGDCTMKYQNIYKNNEIIEQSEDKKYSKRELFEYFKSFIMFYKNITGAGWIDKPNIKRVQVTNVRKGDISKYISTSNNETLIILGYYNYDDNPIMVAWNAYHYVYHDTTRSCYVDVNTLIDGYKKGYLNTVYAKQNIWVFTSENFERFLQEYINLNKVG